MFTYKYLCTFKYRNGIGSKDFDTYDDALEFSKGLRCSIYKMIYLNGIFYKSERVI